MNSFLYAALMPKIAERLGVSTDELCGLKNESISIYDRVMQHISDTQVMNIAFQRLEAPDVMDC